MKKIEVDFEEYVAAVKEIKADLENLISNPPADLNDRAKAWKKLSKKYTDLSEVSPSFNIGYFDDCDAGVIKNDTCIKCHNESCIRYWQEVLHNEFCEVGEQEYCAGESRLLEICKEVGVPVLLFYDAENTALDERTVKDKETGNEYFISFRSNGGGFPYLVYSKVGRDGKKAKYFNYTKLYSPNKVYSGSVTEEDIKGLLTSKFEI